MKNNNKKGTKNYFKLCGENRVQGQVFIKIKFDKV